MRHRIRSRRGAGWIVGTAILVGGITLASASGPLITPRSETEYPNCQLSSRVVADAGVSVLVDGSGKIAFPNSPGVKMQLFAQGARPELSGVAGLAATVLLTGMELDGMGCLTGIEFVPTNGMPVLPLEGQIFLESLDINRFGEICAMRFSTTETVAGAGCVTVLIPQPDGTVKIDCNLVDCNGECEMLVVPNGIGGFTITCACLEEPPGPKGAGNP